jgi:adenine-specific DNA-methyltransferase
VSRLTDLLRQARQVDPQLGADLESEIAALTKRRTFGLVFERHQPEAVELPGRPVRRGDKVRVLPPRGNAQEADQRLWRVVKIAPNGIRRVADLEELDQDEPETKSVSVDDLVVVAEFKDTIYPGLVETGRVHRGGAKPFHTVINAENFHALELLTYTHRHAIDAIYIDPPYNTGAKDWKYNNNYVEADDDYRHSKWLAFIERRLKIARELLDPDDSVLIVTIDEKEVHRLGLLLEQLFQDAVQQMVTIVINPLGQARRQELARVEEHAFLLLFGDAKPSAVADDLLTAEDAVRTTRGVRWEWLLRGGTNARRIDRPNLFYPIFIDPETNRIEAVGDRIASDVQRESVSGHLGLVTVWPVNTNGGEGRWRVSAEALRAMIVRGYAKVGAYDAKNDRYSILYLGRAQIQRIENGELRVSGHDSNGAVIVEGSIARAASVVPKTVWNRLSHRAGEYGNGILRKLIPGHNFPFPKSLYAVEDILRPFVKDKPNAVVLDFFAGSGTTAHAVIRLNRQDGGRRQCISVTNNEVSADDQARLRKTGLRPGDPKWEALGICDYITKPRMTAAITGKTPEGDPITGDYKFTDEFPMSDGFDENAAFFTLTYEAPLSVQHNRAFARIAAILWMRAGSEGRIISDLGEQGWDVAETYGVLANLDHAEAFLSRLSKAKGVRLAFIVTDDDGAFQMVCRDLPEAMVPVRLYESYLQNFEINTGRTL